MSYFYFEIIDYFKKIFVTDFKVTDFSYDLIYYQIKLVNNNLILCLNK